MKKTIDQILDYIVKKGRVTPSETVHEFGLSRQIIARHFKKLIETNQIIKLGNAPKVYYQSSVKVVQNIENLLENELIEKNFLYISPLGQVRTGTNGFTEWCKRTKQDPLKTSIEYTNTIAKYEKFKNNNIIDSTLKLHKTFKDNYLDKVFYGDFYSIERFGKTKLGQLVLYAKQSQNKNLIKQVISQVEPQIKFIIDRYKIDAIAFIPPSVKRNVQIMSEFEKSLTLGLRVVKLQKISNDIIVPQKTLSKLEDRVENADKTIFVPSQAPCKNILLIDDAVGSGATLNQTAKHLRESKIVTGKILAFTPVGSYKGFEVISEI
jgi:hypothetical protein